MTPLLTTFRDAIDQLVDFTGGTAAASTQRDLRTAIQQAYIELQDVRHWRYFQKQHRVITNAPQTADTIQYTQATRTFTITGATFPSWTPFASIDVLNVISELTAVSADGLSATAHPVLNPGQDIAAGTTYTLMQSIYPLPPDFHAGTMPINEQYNRHLMYAAPDVWMTLQRIRQAQGRPTTYTYLQDSRLMGTLALALYPWPDGQYTEDFIYVGRGRPLRITGYGSSDIGTCQIASGTNIVQALTGTFTADHVGSAFRVRTDATTPDGTYGLNPFEEQKIVSGLVDSTHVTTDTNFVNAYNNAAWVVSDPVDLPPHLTTVFARACQKQIAIQRQMKNLPLIVQAFEDSLQQAMDADSVVNAKRSMWDGQVGVTRRIARQPLGPNI